MVNPREFPFSKLIVGLPLGNTPAPPTLQHCACAIGYPAAVCKQSDIHRLILFQELDHVTRLYRLACMFCAMWKSLSLENLHEKNWLINWLTNREKSESCYRYLWLVVGVLWSIGVWPNPFEGVWPDTLDPPVGVWPDELQLRLKSLLLSSTTILNTGTRDSLHGMRTEGWAQKN